MFKVYLENDCFYDDRMDNPHISGMSLELEENKAGSFEFTLYPQHPYYQAFERMKSIVTVTQNDEIVFRGRLLNTEESFRKERKFTCEGELAFLNDSLIHPDGNEGDDGSTSATPIKIFTKIISDHNSQVTEERRFIIGVVSIDGFDEEVPYAYMDWEKSLDALEDLLERCGGHISFRHEQDGIYIDWIDSYELMEQVAEFGKNILDITQTVEGGDIVTGILPTGDENKNTGYPTNISEMDIPENEYHKQMFPITSSDLDLGKSFPINGNLTEGNTGGLLGKGNIFGDKGLVIVNKPLYEKYGAIIETRSYDGYPADWIDQALEEVDSLTGLMNTIEISIIDMAWLGGTDFLKVGKKLKVSSKQHAIDGEYTIAKLDIDLQNPESNKISLDRVVSNFVDSVVRPDSGLSGSKGNSAVRYSYAYALSDSNTICPLDSEFSDTLEVDASKYLWVRVTTLMSDGTSTKSYYCTGKGEGSKFEISAPAVSVIRNDRLTTSQTIEFTADIVGYTNARPRWYVNDRLTAEGGTLTMSIPYRKAEAFTVSLFNGTKLMDTLNVIAIDKTEDPLYLGKFDESVPTEAYDDEGNTLIIAVGDYFLCSKSFDTFKAGNPYRWNGTSWEEIAVTGDNANVSPDMYGKIMSSCLDDAISSDTVENTKYMSWFKRLAGKEAFFENLFSQIITVLGEFRFSKTIGDTLATFDITQDGVTMRYGPASEGDDRPIVFQIDFSTGLVTATNANISGTVNAKDGTFTGTVNATKGSFNGEIYTPAFYSTYGEITPLEFSAASSVEQGLTLYAALSAKELPTETYLRCKIGNNEGTYYLRFFYYKREIGWLFGAATAWAEDYGVTFYDSDFNAITLESLGYSMSGSSDTSTNQIPSGSVYTWQFWGSNSTNGYRGRYVTQPLSITVDTGGEGVVVFKDTIPLSEVGLQKRQLYCENGFLKIVL